MVADIKMALEEKLGVVHQKCQVHVRTKQELTDTKAVPDLLISLLVVPKNVTTDDRDSLVLTSF